MKVAVIGAGLIGRAWSIVFARGGADVALFDSDSRQCEAALAWAGRSLAEMADHGLIDDPDMVLKRISVAATLPTVLAGAGYVQENIVERPEPKQALFAEIEAHAEARAVLASSSSAIMPSIIFGGLKTRSRCLVAHPMNPPHLAPIVELCGAEFTAAGPLERAEQLMKQCGMTTIRVEKEIEGFILNPLQVAVFNEAFRLIEGGYVSPSDLDATIKDGLGLRWSFMGPVETMDLNAPAGVGDYLRRYGGAIRRFGETPAKPWSAQVAAVLDDSCRAQRPTGELADAQAWRDRRLMALARHKKDQPKQAK